VIASRDTVANEPLSTVRQLELLRDLQRLANERAQEEARIGAALEDGLRAAEQTRDRMAADIERQTSERRTQATAEHDDTTAAIRSRYEQGRNAAQQQYKGLRQGVESEHSRIVEAAHAEKKETSWEATTVYEALQGQPRERYQEATKRLDRNHQELAVLEHDAAAIMQMRRQWREFPPVAATNEGHAVAGNHQAAHHVVLGRLANGGAAAGDGDVATADPVELALQRVDALTSDVRAATVALDGQRLPRLFAGGGPFGVFVSAWIAAAVPSALLLGWQNWWWIAVSLVIAAVATGGLLAWLWPIARRQSGEQFQTVRQLIADARQAMRYALDEARRRGEREAQALVAERDRQITESEQKHSSIVSERERWKDSEIGQAGRTFPQRLAELRDGLDRGLAEIKQKYAATLAQLTAESDRRTAENRQRFERTCAELRCEHDRDWEALAERWRDGLAALRGAWEHMQAECERLFPDWDSTEFADWPLPTEAAPAIRFGQLTLDMKHVKHGLPQDERLRPVQTTMELPALMTLDEHPVLLISAEEEGRREAIEVLQLAMLRMLTAMPPGKVRFTILDPVGLGENFASFMHLADFDEQLIASRIWTDGRQIEEQLTRLTAHMETVLQKYLRNEFATIHEYNAQAGEVAEPFQVLVVANFPTNFSEAAARKLVSIATSGPRCGVYTLMMVDRKQKMPANFDLSDLTAEAVHLEWVAGVERQRAPNEASKRCQEPFLDGKLLPRDPRPEKVPDTFLFGRFRWRYPAFEHLSLALDRPPTAERFNDVVRAAGRAAKDSMKVEVPFEQVAPAENEYWTGNCAKELVVPIGRAGARRLQPVRLGKGTSQHLLVCGKTGSGKSTFLHAFITNTALMYSPDEVEFYLIDFKKGVEFKTYATHHLPHARVIAIESEREFGLSVLERLDEELKRRGDLFRAAGVQDLPDYRAHVGAASRAAQEATQGPSRQEGPTRMPRVVLVIDEFQELFVEDDKLAQDSALLLDRLVRQGRAFGIHVMLGSQTLSGAYSLARSTTGQMAVRVALQCSETDAHLILPDERNEAARFLSRPGEAIYNDQNGLLAGNHPFQVVWLPESQRIGYLKQIESKSREQGVQGRATIVFEGDQPADPADNVKLREVLEHGPSGAAGAPQHAWLGAAVAIKEPTVATFARHAGSNLLVVGAWDDSALGVLTNAVVALAAQNPAGSREQGARSKDGSDAPRSPLLAPRFYVLDGTRPEATEAGAWQRIADALPHKIDVGGQRDTARIINEVAMELARREAAGEDNAPPMYLVIFNGGRFRDLRRGEDDFSFSTDREKPASPDKQWAEILRNGPAWGVFTLLWCDSYNNVNRMMDRMTLREFEMRVAFQMSAADSSSFLDTPAATRLNVHRGLFASEDLGTLEKFRPYGVPTKEWLAEVRQRILDRSDAV
jgi:hypothetical protein